MRNILVLNAHPYEESFCNALAQTYENGAKSAGHTVQKVAIRELDFDPILRYGYTKRMELEPDLVRQQELLRQCDHLVIVLPFWWGGMPALLKGYFDRVFLPDFAFTCQEIRCKGLLQGKTASIIYTQDAPFLWTFFMYRDAFWHTLKSAILRFCGFGSVRRKCFTGVRKSTDMQRKEWLEEVYALGKRGF
ncbi:MAG: NAD(P)H-dependent oxidoreductase [Sulfurimonadaceae bacterium]|jgi:putative NADPH-quinone reductase